MEMYDIKWQAVANKEHHIGIVLLLLREGCITVQEDSILSRSVSQTDVWDSLIENV